jgi:SSS family solute:Na+ symporter
MIHRVTAQLYTVDLAVLLAYLVGIVAGGCLLARKSSTTEGFIAGGRSMAGWVIGLSIFGTYVSSISYIANPGKSFGGNWNAFAFGIGLPLAAWIATRWFVPFYRRVGEVSAYAHLENRFGAWARVYGVVCFLLTQLARIGTILYLVALAVAPLTGWDVRWIILGTGVLIILYTLIGGIEAVIWTDVIQSLVLTAGILVSLGVLFTATPGGVTAVMDVAAKHEKFSLGSLGSSLTESTFWVVLVYGLFINLQNFGIDQCYVQRYAAAESEAAAKRSVWIGALLYMPVSALLFLAGTALFAFYQLQPELLPAGTKPDEVFPFFIATQLPVGVTGLLVAAILAAAMSSVDSSLNSSATLILKDGFQRFSTKTRDERGEMRVLRFATLIVGLLGIGMALAMIDVKSALDAWWSLAGVFSGGMLGLFLLGTIARRARNPAAVAGVSVGVLTIFWLALSPQLPDSMDAFRNHLHHFMTIVIGTLVILLVGLLVSRFTSRDS